jgi:hypothetical protein
MTNLQELIDTANILSKNLEIASNDDRRFCVDIQLILEKMSWELYRTANDLQEIRNYI